MEYRAKVELRPQGKFAADRFNRFELRTEDFTDDESFLEAAREQLAELLNDEREAEESEL